jgi:hypothetical protein
MTQPEAVLIQECNSLDSQDPITIDPLSFFEYASSSTVRWRELIGLTINHCTFGLGTIRKIDGDYIYVDLPQRQGKKNLTEFGLDSFQRGFFNNLQIDDILQQRITAAAEAARIEQSKQVAEESVKPSPKKKRKSPTKATKKEEKSTPTTV